MESLSVALGSRSYPIHIGAGVIDQRALFAPHLHGSAAIITNKVVAPLYGRRSTGWSTRCLTPASGATGSSSRWAAA
jgi:3-dehydroquinate synthetase